MNFKTTSYEVIENLITYKENTLGKLEYAVVGQLNEYKLAKIAINLENDYFYDHFLNVVNEITRFLVFHEYVLKIIYHVANDDLVTINLLKEAKYVLSKEIDENLVEYKITKNLI